MIKWLKKLFTKEKTFDNFLKELIKEIESGLGESKRVFKKNEKVQDEDIFHEVLEPKIWPYWTVKIIEYNVR